MEGFDGSRNYDAARRRRRTEVLDNLVKVLRAQGPLPEAVPELVWAAERFTGGAYGSYNPPGVLTSLGHVAGTPHGLVHFASSDHSPEWPGYMDGAIREGEKAAGEALAHF